MRQYVTVFAAVIPLFAQTSVQDPVIRVSVDLVQVDATVTDAQGHHVPDLKAEDFEILEDGTPQKITHFSYAQAGAPQPHRASGDEDRAASRQPRPEDIRRTVVLVADDLSFTPAEFPRVRTVLKNFVEHDMQPGDLVSIMRTSGGMGALEQLTNDKRSLYAAIARIVYSPSRNQFGTSISSESHGAVSDYIAAANAALAASRAPRFAAGSTSALGYAIQGLRDMPGRKAVVLFAAGFSGAAAPIVEMAHRSSVVIYTLDMRGLVAVMPPGYWASEGPLDLLAHSTGGVYFHNTNGFDAALRKALDDMSSYYLLGYQPRREDFERVNGNTQFHKIEVRVLRSGLQVRSRNGFAGTPDPPARPAGNNLREALFSPFHANGFPVQLSAFYSAATEKDPKTRRRSTSLRATLAIDARGLRFADAANDKKQLSIQVVAAAYGENNEAIADVDKTFTVTVSPEEMKQIVSSGLVYGVDIEIPKPGPYQLRVAARDTRSGQTGSATTFIEIPDYNRPQIALSSVLVRDSDAGRNADLTRAGVLGAGSPVTRMFAPGAVLNYECAVFGALLDRQTGKPKLELQVRLFRGPEQIFTGQAIPLTIAEGNSTEAVHATGEIRLPATLPAGDYSLELSAYDRLEKKEAQGAAQWADFTLVHPQ